MSENDHVENKHDVGVQETKVVMEDVRPRIHPDGIRVCCGRSRLHVRNSTKTTDSLKIGQLHQSPKQKPSKDEFWSKVKKESQAISR